MCARALDPALSSQGLIDLIHDVEVGCSRSFDPLGIDFDAGATLQRIAKAYTGEH
jgi:hypothetical protein